MRAPYDDPSSTGLFVTQEEYEIACHEFSFYFARLMLNRMLVSFYAYGKVEDSMTPRLDGPAKVIDALASAAVRMKRYQETSNAEYLVDAANFMMMEFMYPQVPNAFFKATDSDQSPGRVEKSSGELVPHSNRDLL